MNLPSRSPARARRYPVPIALLLTIFAGIAHAAPATFDIESYRGRVVVVDFWASWCKPCRESIPWLNELRTRYAAQGLVIVGINVDAEPRDAERFMREVPMSFDVIYDSHGDLAQKFQLPGMPASYLFDRNGTLAERHLGFKESQRAAFEATLANLLARKSREPAS